MADIDYLAIKDDVSNELNRMEDSYGEIDNRISDLEEVRERNLDLQAKLSEYVNALENLGNDMEEVEVVLEDAENLGIY